MWAHSHISVKSAGAHNDEACAVLYFYVGFMLALGGETLSDLAEGLSSRGSDTSSGTKPVSTKLSRHFSLFELAVSFILDQHFHHVSGSISDRALTALKWDLLSCVITNLLFQLTLIKWQGATGWWYLSGFRMLLPRTVF